MGAFCVRVKETRAGREGRVSEWLCTPTASKPEQNGFAEATESQKIAADCAFRQVAWKPWLERLSHRIAAAKHRMYSV